MNRNPDLRKRIALELWRRVRKNKAELHELRTLFWECTLRCNAACRHCGSDCRVSAAQPDMPLADFLRVIDSITPHVDPHRVMVTLTGGEALVRPDIAQCGQALYERGYPWALVSNGLLLTHDRLSSLVDAGLRSVAISLDGFEEAHNWLRGNPLSFRGAVRAISLLAKTQGVVWDVVTCVNQKNFGDLPTFKDFLVQLGVSRWRIFTIFPVGRAAQSPELQIDNRQFTALLDFIRACRREGQLRVNFACEGFLGNYEGEVRDHLFFCNAGINTASILADGSISACPSIRANYHQGNIYKDDFMTVWNNGFRVYRDREWARQGACADCKMFRYCEGNGMHLHDDEGKLLVCHLQRIDN